MKLAAKRAFVRTTTQAYAAMLAAGVTATAVLAVIRGDVDLVETAVTAAVTVAAPPLAGLQAYLSVTSKGIPEEYADATLAAHATLDSSAQRAGLVTATSRVARRRDYR